jgi:hypothetical protein
LKSIENGWAVGAIHVVIPVFEVGFPALRLGSSCAVRHY